LSAATQGRLAVGVVGATAVGIAMAQALAGVGHLLVGITANTPEELDRCDAMLNGVDVLPLGDLLARAELVLLAVPEADLLVAIAEITEQKLWKPGQLVAHTSASRGIGVLSAAANAGVIPLAIHPAMRFTGSSLDLNRMRDSFLGSAHRRSLCRLRKRWSSK